ncbi:DNA alkylation repair protein [Klebsiella oxytoca]|uniref:DNA alkylation repair protein n=1 Tax=Klebsiella oxytoca TaxID=571 RepID=UPI0010933633|nr:DNA alkylation repair protein [Klebsiella oxytoca]TGN40791.1 DNA alkylation repair protein [Klebsiella oxytoca]
MTSVRKGVTRVADVTVDIQQALSRGKIQSAPLAECLAINQAQLVRAVFPELPPDAMKEIDAACESGILKRMDTIGAVLLDALGSEGIEKCRVHRADSVRGWACFMIRNQPGLHLSERLTAIRSLADDGHFAVREWAWMAIRPHIADQLDVSIGYLAQWTVSPSEYLRRFACEVLRPRGVWCTHISALKHEPELAISMLMPLRADPSVYVQDSVSNWLNDAAKDQPDWVRNVCSQWLHTTPTDATRRICQRALRNLK